MLSYVMCTKIEISVSSCKLCILGEHMYFFVGYRVTDLALVTHSLSFLRQYLDLFH